MRIVLLIVMGIIILFVIGSVILLTIDFIQDMIDENKNSKLSRRICKEKK